MKQPADNAPGSLPGPPAPLSILVVTYNEEVNIEHLLANVTGWAAEVVVVDSYSTDQTLEICRKYGARVYQHPFENQAKQCNWALDNVPMQSEWILRLDADEFLTPELIAELRAKLPTVPPDVSGILMNRRVYCMGRWMKHGDYYPLWLLRLWRNGKGRFEEVTEEKLLLSEGRTIQMKHDFVDYNRKGLTFWVDKHNHWAMGEMLDTMALAGQAKLPESTVKPSFFGTQERRRRWLKQNLYAQSPLFLRAFMYWYYRYFFKLGFLDGREGLIFHFMQGLWYRFLIDAKIYEARKFGLAYAQASREYTGSKPLESAVESKKER